MKSSSQYNDEEAKYHEERIMRLAGRLERGETLVHDLEALLSEVRTDIQAEKLQLSALRYKGITGDKDDE